MLYKNITVATATTTSTMSGLMNTQAPWDPSTSCVVNAPAMFQFSTASNNTPGYAPLFMQNTGSFPTPNYGMITTRWDGPHLRQPQLGEYLHQEFFNGGCMAQTCPSASVCPGGTPVRASAATAQMYDSLFASMDRQFTVPSGALPASVYDLTRSQSC